MLGGLARRVALVEKLRTIQNSILVTDSGDLFFTLRNSVPEEKALAKARLIARAYKRMGVAAVNVGDLDLIQGLDFLRQESSQGLPLISANLLDSATRKTLFPPFVIRQVSGIRVAFFGLLSARLDPENRERIQKVLGQNAVIKDPIETAGETVRKLNGQADLIVLLSDLGYVQEREVAKAVPGIHFIFGDHDGRGSAQPNAEGKTFLLQSYAKGMYMGQLQATIKDAAFSFQDAGHVLRLKEQLRTVDLQLVSLQKGKEQNPGAKFDASIQSLSRWKAQIQEEIERSPTASESKSNSILWNLVTMEGSLPENNDVRKWFEEAGIDKD